LWTEASSSSPGPIPPLRRGDLDLRHAAREPLKALAWVATTLFWVLGQAGRYIVGDEPTDGGGPTLA
jgi:hypothetical protein